MSWRRKGKKNYSEIRTLLFSSSISPQEQEEMIFVLINDEKTDAYEILGDFLSVNEYIQPLKSIMNYKGETISSLKPLVADHFAQATDIDFAQKILLNTLTKYYSYDELRKSIFNTLKKLKLAEIGAKHVLSLIWNVSPPIQIAKSILFELLPTISKNEQNNYLYWYLFTPAYVTQDFPTKFHNDIYEQLKTLQDKDTAVYMLIQAIYSEITKKISPDRWYEYLNDYLKIFRSAMQHVGPELIKHHEFKEITISNIRKILSVVSSADSENFLHAYQPYSSEKLSKNYLNYWKNHIQSRFLMRTLISDLLVKLGDNTIQHEVEIVEKAQNFESSEKLKFLIREIENTFENPTSMSQDSGVFTQIELLTEILEWRFDELLSTINFTRFDLISELLLKMPKLIDLIPQSSQLPDRITQLLLITSQEAVNQFIVRKNLVQKVLMNETFHDQALKREEKYQKLSLEPTLKLQMQFNLITDLTLKQKKRFLQFMFQIDQVRMREFLEKLNNVLNRIYNNPTYYVSFKLELSLPSERTLIFREDIRLPDTLIKFYRYFEGMVDQEFDWKRFNIVGLRRIEAIMDLVNDFIAHLGIIDFDTVYYNTENDITKKTRGAANER